MELSLVEMASLNGASGYSQVEVGPALGTGGFIYPLDEDLCIVWRDKKSPIFSIQPSNMRIDDKVKTYKAESASLIEESLNNIRTFFSFNISELAKLFDVTRPTIYNWQENKARPSKDTLFKMTSLNRVVAEFYPRFGSPLGNKLHMPLVGKKSLCDLMTSRKLDEQKLIKYLEMILAKNSKPSLSDLIKKHGIIRAGNA